MKQPDKRMETVKSESVLEEENRLPTQPYDKLIAGFVEDSGMPDEFCDYFKKAIKDDKEALAWLYDYLGETYFLSLTEISVRETTESLGLLCRIIGELYYTGSGEPLLGSNKEKAFQWYCLSANQGNFYGAMGAGDMAKTGDGILVRKEEAFTLYQKALEIENSSAAYERLASCYQSGIGTSVDMQKAREYFLISMLGGNTNSFYQYLSLGGFNQREELLLSKAVSSLDFTTGYFEMAYGGLDGYSASPSKKKVVGLLNKVWEDETDPVVLELRRNMESNEYFPKEFVENCLRVSYTYSYHNFADTYGIKPNRGFEDGKKIKFGEGNSEKNEFADYNREAAEGYLKYDSCEYYEQDFDGDGEDEIGIPIHSGAGGAFMADGFCIFKKNKDGLYEEYESGPNCTLRDAMRVIRFEGRIYFITNPYSDTENSLNSMIVKVIDKTGKSHEMKIDCTKYQLKQVVSYSYENNEIEDMDSFIKYIQEQAKDAVKITKKHEMYHPNDMVPMKESQDSSINEVYFMADIENNGDEKIIRKRHAIEHMKYYDDYNLFQIYESKEELLKDEEDLLDFFNDDYYGIHSAGNVYDLLPIVGQMVQFWTCKWKGKTYCLALTNDNLVYSLQVICVKDGDVNPVYYSIFLDEAQLIKVVDVLE